MGNIARYLIYGQLAFFSSVFISIFLAPQSLATRHGITYYGIHQPTIIPYVTGSIISAWFIYKAAKSLPRISPFPTIRYVLFSFVIINLALLVTPHTWGSLFDWSHQIMAFILFSTELILSIWLVIILNNRSFIDVALLLLLAIDGIFVAVYVPSSNGYLLQGQLIFQFLFTVLLINVLTKLLETAKSSSGSTTQLLQRDEQLFILIAALVLSVAVPWYIYLYISLK